MNSEIKIGDLVWIIFLSAAKPQMMISQRKVTEIEAITDEGVLVRVQGLAFSYYAYKTEYEAQKELITNTLYNAL